MSFLYIVLTSFFLSFTTQNEIPYTSIERAFSSGNASEIVNLGKDKMLINVLGKEGAYSQSQATLVLKDFFDKKPCVAFKFILRCLKVIQVLACRNLRFNANVARLCAQLFLHRRSACEGFSCNSPPHMWLSTR